MRDGKNYDPVYKHPGSATHRMGKIMIQDKNPGSATQVRKNYLSVSTFI
jgi:hypothetical protein